SNRAEAKGRVSVELEISYIEDSIRVDDAESAILSDVVYYKLAPDPDKVQEITATQRQVDALQRESDQNLNADAVRQFLDMFGSRRIAIGKWIRELDVQIAAAEEELRRVENEAYEDTPGRTRATKIIVTVLAETGDRENLP
ncbi:hypothetical protein FRC11_012922, partial [Ceratobasidium sp. 423]